ncbi:hypothetical protein ABE61_00655 [Lysinibacillus sphaericus]|uniref:hypothetical protein n=1 Tax=Lysinibacillus sphaericus TaxID=1421 RepID=UPI0018CE2CDA|nr:hypothetical protein [Lysinibacillus sphaericus]MBG9452633.1 hypothetical protein [Lysinibacillus sphaericus]MBG9479109.1 hypothetical protein [Lysinibacillus sphaericus]MBG9591293.1 hypothetical protein [Lysinibacillus sphaericus]
MIIAIMDNALAFILSSPLILIYFKSLSHENLAWRWTLPFWFLNHNMIRYFMSFGDIFWVVLIWQFLFIWPICIGIYCYLYKKEYKWEFYIGLKKKHGILLGSLIVLCISSLGICMYDTNKKVIAFHEQVMKEFEDSSDRPQYLIQNSVTPSTLLSLSDQINEVRNGKVRAATFPWKSKVIVVMDKNQKEFTYVRFNKGWKLDGIYSESSFDYSE